MHSRSWVSLGTLSAALALFSIGIALSALTLSAEEPSGEKNAPAEQADQRVSVTSAREQARLAHQIYAATLDAMHHHFFRNDRSVLPARAMEDVFSDIAKQSGVNARWISVNTKPMSIHHEPKSEFEKKAAAEIAAGKEHYEFVEDGFYRRAGAIPLGAGCVGCHNGFFSAPPKSPRFAALVISVPVTIE